VLHHAFLAEKLILSLKQQFFFLSLSFLTGFLHNPSGQFVRVTHAFGRCRSMHGNTYDQTERDSTRYIYNQHEIHSYSPLYDDRLKGLVR
jgi:hypothetical protein